MLYWLSKPTKRLLAEMSVGVVFFDLLLAAAAFLVLPKTSYPFMPVFKGLCLGAAGAVLMLVHMADTIERSLQSGDPDYAKKMTIMQSMLRRMVFIVGMGFCWYFFKADLLAIVLGAMGMKAGAYLQPLVHKVSGAADEPYAESQGLLAEGEAADEDTI